MKKLIAMLLALVMVFGLVACSVETVEPTTAAPVATEAGATEAAGPAPVEISLWTFPVGKWGDEATVSGWVSAFNAKYPHITVNVEYLNYDNGDDKVSTAIEGGQAPNLIFEGPERLIANYAAKGLLLDISDQLTTDAGKQLYESIVNTCSIDGKLYAYPISQMAHCMAINYELFESAGALEHINIEEHTWKSVDDFFAAVQKVHDVHNMDVLSIYCKDQGGDQGTRHMISNIAGGTAWSNPEHTEFTVNNEANAQALARLKAQDGVVFNASQAGGDEYMAWLQGFLAMGTCWNATLHANNKELVDSLDWTVFPMAFPSDSTPVLAGGFYCLGIFDNADDAKDEAAKLFIEFIGSDEVYKEAVLAAGQWATRDIGNIYEGNELMATYGMFAPMFGDYYQITTGWTEFRYEMWNALQRINNGDGTVESIKAELDTVVANVEAALAAK